MDAENALDHAWKYFHLHAQQRITIFNYYVVFTGLLITGIATAFRDIVPNTLLTASLGGLLTGLSFLFYKLDERISFLIKRAEDVIGAHEPHGANLFKEEIGHTKTATENGQWTQGRVFRAMFAVMAAVGVVVVLLSVFVEVAKITSSSVVSPDAVSKESALGPEVL